MHWNAPDRFDVMIPMIRTPTTQKGASARRKVPGSWFPFVGVFTQLLPQNLGDFAPQHQAVLLVYLFDPARNRWVASVITQADYRINNMNKHGLDF